MIFAPIANEAETTGNKVTDIWKTVKTNIAAPFQKENGIIFNESFSKSLEKDRQCLKDYREAINNNIPAQEAHAKTMRDASVAAQDLAKSENFNIKAIQDFTKKQKTAEITTQAQGKSLGNIRSIINEYNSALKNNSNGLTDCGLKQDELTEAVDKSNKSLGGYLKGLNGAKASMMAIKVIREIPLYSMSINIGDIIGMSFCSHVMIALLVTYVVVIVKSHRLYKEVSKANM